VVALGVVAGLLAVLPCWSSLLFPKHKERNGQLLYYSTANCVAEQDECFFELRRRHGRGRSKAVVGLPGSLRVPE